MRFYTHLGYYVVTYNYRGTGASTGDVTPWNTVSDAETIAHFVSRKYRISPQIVHGTSIGGFVVSQFSDETPILVFDRTFSDMNSLVHCYVRIISYCFFTQIPFSLFLSESVGDGQ